MRGLSCGSASTSASSKEEPSAADARPNALLAAYYNRVCFLGFFKRHLQLQWSWVQRYTQSAEQEYYSPCKEGSIFNRIWLSCNGMYVDSEKVLVQETSSSASALQHLPANVALCDPPDATIGYETVIQGAQVKKNF